MCNIWIRCWIVRLIIWHCVPYLVSPSARVEWYIELVVRRRTATFPLTLRFSVNEARSGQWARWRRYTCRNTWSVGRVIVAHGVDDIIELSRQWESICEARVIKPDPKLLFNGRTAWSHFRVGWVPRHSDQIVHFRSIAAVASRAHADRQLIVSHASVEIRARNACPRRSRIVPVVLVVCVGTIWSIVAHPKPYVCVTLTQVERLLIDSW